MKNALILFAFFLCMVGLTNAQDAEKEAARVPLENYIKAHATGDPEYARKAFYTEGNMTFIRDGKYTSEPLIRLSNGHLPANRRRMKISVKQAAGSNRSILPETRASRVSFWIIRM